MGVQLIGLSAPNVAIPHFTAIGEMRSIRLYGLVAVIRRSSHGRLLSGHSRHSESWVLN